MRKQPKALATAELLGQQILSRSNGGSDDNSSNPNWSEW